MDSSGLGLGTAVGSCEHVNEPSGAIKDKGCVEHLTDYQLVKESPTCTHF
jgi:hypothetical protein